MSHVSTMMEQGEDVLVHRVLDGLRTIQTSPYRDLEENQLQSRAKRLVSVFLRSVATDQSVFQKYIEEVVEERIAEGYYLREMQSALSALEETAWRIVVRNSEPEDHARRLARITGVIGAGKDRIARIYLDHKETAETELANLQGKIELLFRGTDSDPETV